MEYSNSSSAAALEPFAGDLPGEFLGCQRFYIEDFILFFDRLC